MVDELSFEDAFTWGVSTFTFLDDVLTFKKDEELDVDFHPEQDASRAMPKMQEKMVQYLMFTPPG